MRVPFSCASLRRGKNRSAPPFPGRDWTGVLFGPSQFVLGFDVTISGDMKVLSQAARSIGCAIGFVARIC